MSKNLESVRWAIIFGAVGFAAGFFGPMILAPEANQGPLVGILMSGPGGFVLGFMLYGVARLFAFNPKKRQRFRNICAVVFGVSVLAIFLFPAPERHGYAFDLEVRSCQSSSEATDRIIDYWKKRISATHWAEPRPGWEQQMHEELAKDQGSLIEAAISRKRKFDRSRRFWNKGKIYQGEWQPSQDKKTFYIANKSCADFAIGMKGTFYQSAVGRVRSPNEWPPSAVESFMPYPDLKDIPSELRQ